MKRDNTEINWRKFAGAKTLPEIFKLTRLIGSKAAWNKQALFNRYNRRSDPNYFIGECKPKLLIALFMTAGTIGVINW
jgi:hypothetical protein